MDPIARRKLESLLASLPSGQDRQLLVDEFVGGDVLLGRRVSPEDHARAVVELVVAEGTDLRLVFALLRDRHQNLIARIDRTENFVIEEDRGDEEQPTEMVDPIELRQALDAQKSVGRKSLPNRNLASLGKPGPAELGPSTPAPTKSSADDSLDTDEPTLPVDDSSVNETTEPGVVRPPPAGRPIKTPPNQAIPTWAVVLAAMAGLLLVAWLTGLIGGW